MPGRPWNLALGSRGARLPQRVNSLASTWPLVQNVGIAIEPDRARQGEAVTVTVSGPADFDPSYLLMQVVSGSGTALLPRRLPTYARQRHGNPDIYEATIETASYEPGEYIVDVSSSESFRPQNTVSGRFTVVPPTPLVLGASMRGSGAFTCKNGHGRLVRDPYKQSYDCRHCSYSVSYEDLYRMGITP